MKLSRTTPANLFKIKKPIWDGRRVGLNTQKIGTHNEVRIDYRNSDGDLLYPQPLYISGEKARTYETMQLKKYPIKLYLIPINEMETLERI